MSAMDGNACIEWAPFRLKAGVSEEMLLRTSAELQEGFVRQQPGFVRRELLRGTDGQWVDLVVWRDAAAAAAVALTAASSPVCASYFALMEGVDHADPGVGVQYFERAARFGLPAA
jgi:hypothetical protein